MLNSNMQDNNKIESENKLEKVITLLQKRGFILKSAEIYGAPSGLWDYGPLGVRVKNKIINLWREEFIFGLGALEVETSIIMPEQVLKASGHVDKFFDYVATCQKCGKRHRADKLLEEKAQDPTVKESAKVMNKKELEESFEKEGIKCECGGKFKIEEFNLMFKTYIGKDDVGYLRPETAQGIFLDFKSLFLQNPKLPLGIAQIGKSFRNEISPRQGLIRMREFTQMEMEYFFDPEDENFEKTNRDEKNEKVPYLSKEDQENGLEEPKLVSVEEINFPNKVFEMLVLKEKRFMEKLGLKDIRFREMLEKETPHYSKKNIDLEVKTSIGYVEVAGNAYRTNFDLGNHEKWSGESLSVFWNNRKILPHVVEISFGLDRLFYCIMEKGYREGDRDWTWLDIKEVAPYKFAVFPLVAKDGLYEIAYSLYQKIKKDAIFNEKGSIGKRYAKADEIGVPYSITIDYQTKEDSTFTIRDIYTKQQKRIKESDLIALM